LAGNNVETDRRWRIFSRAVSKRLNRFTR